MQQVGKLAVVIFNSRRLVTRSGISGESARESLVDGNLAEHHRALLGVDSPLPWCMDGHF